MMTNQSIAKVLEKLEKLTVGRDARSDDPRFNAMDWSGGNFEDAYQMGVDDGQILLARDLKKLIYDSN
jgi:hypothetical protein